MEKYHLDMCLVFNLLAMIELYTSHIPFLTERSYVTDQPPLSYVNMNLTPPIGNNPVLMNVSQVKQLFFEVRLLNHFTQILLILQLVINNLC